MELLGQVESDWKVTVTGKVKCDQSVKVTFTLLGCAGHSKLIAQLHQGQHAAVVVESDAVAVPGAPCSLTVQGDSAIVKNNVRDALCYT